MLSLTGGLGEGAVTAAEGFTVAVGSMVEAVFTEAEAEDSFRRYLRKCS